MSAKRKTDPGERYAKVFRRIFADAKFRGLSKPQPNAQSLWFHLLCRPGNTSLPGLIVIGEAALAEELEWPVKGLRGAFAELEGVGMAKADWKARLVWIPKATKHNPPANQNSIKSWRPHLALLPECPLRAEAISAIAEYVSTLPAWARSAWSEVNGCGNGSDNHSGNGCSNGYANGSGNQEQEKDQEQDHFVQEQEQEHGEPVVRPLTLSRDDTRGLLVRAFSHRYTQETRSAFQNGGKCDWKQMAQWFDRTAEIRKVSGESLIALVVENWFSDTWVVEKNFPVAHFAKHYPNYLDPKRSPKSRPVTESKSYTEDLGIFADEVSDA